MIARRVVLLALAVACGRSDPRADSAVPGATTATAAAPWVAELGPLLLVPGDSESVAIVLHPGTVDSAALASVRLVGAGGTLMAPVRATSLGSDSLACEAAMLRLSGAVAPGWTVGLASVAPQVTAQRADSIESLAAADSSALAADVARLASGVVSEGSRFRGLPFVVLKAVRATQGDRTLLVAITLRRLPQEAAPLEERVFVVAERTGAAPYSVGYRLTSEGTEDSIEHFALLALLRAGDRPFAIIEREQEAGTRYEVLERTISGEWSVRWSRMLGC